MIDAAFPGFLIAGVALATVAIVLHLLARRPPVREPLPTARFLRRDARTLLRLQRRPTDIPLLLVRILFALALASAFAGLTWTGARAGATRVILLDGSADRLSDWDATRNEARRLAAEGGAARASVIVAYGLNAGHRIVAPADLDRLPRGERPATADAGLRALRSVASQSRWESVDVVWVTRPSWRLWGPDTGLLREALWPGRVAIITAPVSGDQGASSTVAPAATVAPDASAPTLVESGEKQTLAWIFEAAVGSALHQALEALEVRVVSGEGDAGTNPDWIFAEGPSTAALDALLDRAREGSTVVLSGRMGSDRREVPWKSDATDADGAGVSIGAAGAASGGFVVPGYPTPIGSTVERETGSPGDGSHVVAVFEDATPAAAAKALEHGCVVYVAASILDGAATRSPDYPALVAALAEGCSRIGNADGPLDRGAHFALERPDLPRDVEVSALDVAGYPLSSLLLLLALACLAIEVGLTWRRGE